jgi:hypothetical protein
LPKKTSEAAADAQAHLIVQLKDNQLTLCRKAEAVCNDTKPLSGVQTVDSKKRNRHETRTVVVFNQLGFARSGLVDVAGDTDALPSATTVQATAEGGTLFVAQAPSLGYATGDTAASVVPDAQWVTVSASPDAGRSSSAAAASATPSAAVRRGGAEKR